MRSTIVMLCVLLAHAMPRTTFPFSKFVSQRLQPLARRQTAFHMRHAGFPSPAQRQQDGFHMVAQKDPEKYAEMNSLRMGIALLSGAGVLETAAIASAKVFGDGNFEALCFSEGSCADVLSSPWASVFGVPLAAFGTFAYASVLALALAPSGAAQNLANSALLGLTAAMVRPGVKGPMIVAFARHVLDRGWVQDGAFTLTHVGSK